MDLDRYLLDPDLLYDIEKMHQPRKMTRSGKIYVESFRTTSAASVGESNEADIGRGSMQNLPLPVPYVQGRRGLS
jgi:hypothetical protein